MKLPITLVIPTHNRPHYLERLIDYYTPSPFDVLILDSSTNKYAKIIQNSNCTYLHVPGRTFTQKLSDGFDSIKTSFCVMCADDDFIIPDAIKTCVDFLTLNSHYASASGNIIVYIRNNSNTSTEFTAMYTDNLEYEIADEDPVIRLQNFFNPYRSIFYAVHRTDFIKKGFDASRNVVNNLYLNEYLSGILPITCGKYAELPVFYQVREYVGLSDDKTTINLDNIIGTKRYSSEYGNFLDTQSYAMAFQTGKNHEACRIILDKVLIDFSKRLPAIRNYVDTSFTKRLGNFVVRVPIIGKQVIKFYRNAQRMNQLKLIIKTVSDKSSLQKVNHYINKYS